MTQEERVQYGKLTEEVVVKSMVAFAKENDIPCTAVLYARNSIEDQQMKIDFSMTSNNGVKHFNVKSVLPDNATTPNFTCPLSVTTDTYKLVDYIVFLDAYDPSRNMIPEYCYVINRSDLCALNEQGSDVIRKMTTNNGSFYLINKMFIKANASKIKMVYD